MIDQQVVNLIGSVLLTVAGLIGTANVIVHFRVRWFASQMGRHLMAYMAVVALVLDLGIVRFAIGDDSLGFQLLRLAVFAGVPAVMAQRLWLQIKAQRSERATRQQDS